MTAWRGWPPPVDRSHRRRRCRYVGAASLNPFACLESGTSERRARLRSNSAVTARRLDASVGRRMGMRQGAMGGPCLFRRRYCCSNRSRLARKKAAAQISVAGGEPRQRKPGGESLRPSFGVGGRFGGSAQVEWHEGELVDGDGEDNKKKSKRLRHRLRASAG
ncbi:hypothetical protein B296_00028379 [Ensete ventricosum]|uniref:Uncharacterized protein n=1 Tax=Ensete ventricosum TaxID=4639 RepID=A0A426XR81_ENSVE|nr:hypothetical protein B296_00028379 [Ensete ventricosum]